MRLPIQQPKASSLAPNQERPRESWPCFPPTEPWPTPSLWQPTCPGGPLTLNPASPCRGVQQEAPLPLPHLLPHGAHLLPGYHQPAAYQRALRAGPVRLGACRAGAAAQDGLLVGRGQGGPAPGAPAPQAPAPWPGHSRSCLGPGAPRRLTHVCVPQELYLRWVLEARRHILAILQDCPSLRPPIDHLCELLPRLQARYYSIASSSKVGALGPPRRGQCWLLREPGVSGPQPQLCPMSMGTLLKTPGMCIQKAGP